MKLILKVVVACLTFIGFLACNNNSDDTQHPATLNKNVNTVRIVDRPLSRPKVPGKSVNKELPCTSVQISKKKAVYTNLNRILKTRS